MAYIPTIHTFEDDVNENRAFDEAPISGGVDKYNTSNILVTEKKDGSLTKKILTFISVLLILACISVVVYYFYSKWKIKQNENNLNNNIIQQIPVNDGLQNDLSKIFPKLALGISPYISQATQKNNIVILTIKDSDLNIDNYTLFYAYILAHKKDLNSDLFYAFKIQDIVDYLQTDNGLDLNYLEKNNLNDFDSPDNNIETKNQIFSSFISKPKPILENDLSWESKTLKNQDFEVANAGVLTLIYGYSGKKYVVFTTTLKDYFETINSLK